MQRGTECLAVVWAIQNFRVYLEGQEFLLLTDHNALHYILKQTDPRGRIAQWVTFLNQFTYTVKHVQGTKNIVPDALGQRECTNTRVDADDAIDAYPDLGAVRYPGGDCNSSNRQAQVTFNPQPQVMSYLTNTPIKDLRHDRVSLGNIKAPCWEEVKIKSNSKVPTGKGYALY